MDAKIRNLMFDLAQDKNIYSSELNRNLTSEESQDMLRNICFEMTGLNEKSTERDIHRALKKESTREFFQVIEEILDQYVPDGFKDNEFFDNYVEIVNIKDGDVNEFWSDQDIILNVAKVSGSNHDMIMQKLNEGSSYSIPTSVYGAKVGHDIRMFLTGRKNWSDFIAAVGKAFQKTIRNELYTEFMNAANKLPSTTGLVGTGAPSAAKKADFDEIISNVAGLNESDVIILGTKTALKKLNGFANVDWISASQKESVANTGIMGTYEGTTLIEIPQRFENNTVASALVDSNVLLIMPVVDYRPIKFIDYGETILEVTEVGDTVNDQQSYEVTRRMGVGTIITRQFGKWTLE